MRQTACIATRAGRTESQRWSEENGFDIKPMVEIIAHESDQEVLRLAIGLFLKACHDIDDENFGIVLSRLVSRLESSSGSVAVGFIENLQTMFWNIHRHDRVKAMKCGIIPAVVNMLRSVDQEVIYESIAAIENFCKHADCEVISAELIRSGLIQTLNDLCVRYSDNSALKTRIIKMAGTVASKMRDFPVSLVRSLVFEQLTISMCNLNMGDPLRLFGYVNDMIQKSTNKDEMIKVFREYGIVKQLNTIISRRDMDLCDYNGIVKLLETIVDFADNHPDSSIRTELEQGRIFENLMAIVKSNTADHTNRRIAEQIIKTCFQHRVHVANSDIQSYDDNAEIDMKSGMAGDTHGEVRTLVEMRYIQYLQSILCKPMWWIDITNQHIVEQWRADSLDQNISPSTFNFALEQLEFFVKQLVSSDMYWKDVYGIINRESRRNQYIGLLELPNGRCVVYPNRYQHKEQSFELADPTQPGHCKILTFFVVNPACRIVSTAHVAPQQPQWYNSSLDKTPILPELWNDIMQYIQGVQSPAEAKHYRDELTSDRTRIIRAYNEEIYERAYSDW
ncbi:hypothetical protein BATDEDRAFT_25053 [Batrachochytrium dendrobatidis JAM81]|uniref:DUF4246 domain-containing protein n=1 Tax=Batrachochytrium dendrobatidis (strain JAM81 / FGSC 10211) TaxID=684364 RepID=F4P3K0_BATDJ|nr:uncharacterized protein BATDEDRAFT_25053 [Batrachochytrium dendrobatidis JAM81]EGF80210.1 hypothetical protein BATDEDRAFT_25053 [Batrachochytrium dendrobatidis JAM81]|eukprot:XP_006678999.1 hypothetical protein BATDEDRAFT_25053 [Batrachochytrium dendrobatidis JAM81]